MFFEKNELLLKQFSDLSKNAGLRADYVQGGGGNTSVKLADGMMAIKASGFCLSDIEPKNGYAVLSYEMLREFYNSTDPTTIEDVEKAGSDQAKKSVCEIEGLVKLRPSVEAGFHSILNRFVLHSHSVYANLVTCSKECVEIAEVAFLDAEYGFATVPYVDPGAKLTFEMKMAIDGARNKDGTLPEVILMQNHGIVVHHDDPNVCTAIHDDANRRLARTFGIMSNSFPEVSVREIAGGMYLCESDFIRLSLKNTAYTIDDFIKRPLYPDQMVFLNDCFELNSRHICEGKCVASTKTGEMLLHMDEKKALTIAQTVACVLFILENIETTGYELSTMGEDSQNFIAGWESEAYRKSVESKKI